MRRCTQWQRAGLAAAGVAFLLAGLATEMRAARQPEPSQPTEIEVKNLTPAELRRAEAMAHYATGVSLELREGPTAALTEYLQAFQIDPHNTSLGQRLAQYYMSRKEFTNAVSVLESAAKAEPQSADPLFSLGFVYRAMEQNPKAVTALRQALTINPKHLNSLQMLLELYGQDGNIAELKKLLAQAWKQGSNEWQYWVKLGDVQSLVFRQKPTLSSELNPAQIREAYEKALALAPDEPEVLLRLADIYTESKDNTKVIEIYSKLLKLRPDLLQLREGLAKAYLRADDKKRAVAAFEEIIKKDPLRYDVYNSLGSLYEDLEKDDDAISSYQQSLVANPNQLPPSLRIALLQAKRLHYEDAEQTLTAARDKFPTNYQIPYLLGLIYSDQKKFDKAINTFSDVVTLAETAADDIKLDASFYFSYGAACERAGDIDKAAELFKKCIKLDPKKHNAYNYLGYMWADKGIHLDEARELIEKALKLSPDNPAYLDSLGWLLYKLDHAAEALPHLRKAVELMQKEKDKELREDATLFDHLAEVLLKNGQRDEAIEYWKRALKAEPGNKEIAGKLEKLTGAATP